MRSDAKPEELPSESVVSNEDRASAATFASASESRVEATPENFGGGASGIPAATPEQTPAPEPMPTVDLPSEVVAPPAEMVSESPDRSVLQNVTSESRTLADDEVTAALASLGAFEGQWRCDRKRPGTCQVGHCGKGSSFRHHGCCGCDSGVQRSEMDCRVSFGRGRRSNSYPRPGNGTGLRIFRRRGRSPDGCREFAG